MNNKIFQICTTLQSELKQFLIDLIGIPSLSGTEGKIIQRIKGEMEKLGYEQVWIDPMGNLIGRLGNGNQIIAIDGHCDTVGIGNRQTWSTDPFKPTESRGTIYGRGAVDQKGGLAAAVYTGKVIRQIGIPKNLTLLVVASVLEEDYEGLCWQYIIQENNIRPDTVILTEPSDLEIKIGQRGRMEMKIRIEGSSCHGSRPDRGVNAIYKMNPIIQEIEHLNQRLTSASILGKGTIIVTDIKSSAPSLCAVPDSATFHLDRRLTEAETIKTSIREITSLPSVQQAGATVIVPEFEVCSYTGLSYPGQAYYPMWLMNKEDALIQTAIGVIEKYMKQTAKIGVWDFSTNGVATKGIYNIPTIGFGPGEEKFAHTPQDQVRLDDLMTALNFYSAFAIQSCQ